VKRRTCMNCRHGVILRYLGELRTRFPLGVDCTIKRDYTEDGDPHDWLMDCNHTCNQWHGKPVRLQLHWQHPDGTYTFKAQKDVDSYPDAMIAWAGEVQRQHPPPHGTIWLMCDRRSPMFAKGVAP
jgi:hypothetical protein